MTTKKRIVYEALRLFSENGYNGVSMREIAAAVGIKGASLYKHYKGKEDIFRAVFDEMTQQYNTAAAAMKIPSEMNAETLGVYSHIDENSMLNMAESLFSFFAKNEFVASFRRVLVSEQFRSPAAAECYKHFYLEAPIAFQSAVIGALQQANVLTGSSPNVAALHFYSPILYLLSRYDLGCPYEECIEVLKEHVKGFNAVYKCDSNAKTASTHS